MRKSLLTIAGLVSCFTLGLGAASAQEWRLGVGVHDLTGKEDGVNIQAQVVFDDLSFMPVFGGVRPFVEVSTNTSGNLNFIGAGLGTDWHFSPDWFAELQFGIVAHDGRVDLPPPNLLIDGTNIDPADVNDPEVLAMLERRRVLDNEKTYGCEVLFRTSPSIGRKINSEWSAALYWEHLSHGKILCSNGKNEGLDNLGVRVSRRF